MAANHGNIPAGARELPSRLSIAIAENATVYSVFRFVVVSGFGRTS
jgi:hypothetical protein